MNLTEQVHLLFDGFQDELCRPWDGYNACWRPNWKDEAEAELNLIREHSPVSLPEDYCELFRRFGGGGIDDTRPNRVILTMTFWTWSDMKDLDATVDFLRIVPTRFPLGMTSGIWSTFK